MSLNPKARRILNSISRLWKKKGYPPTRRDIMEDAGISSTSIVQYWMAKMRDDGLVDWDDGIGHSVTVTRKGKRALDNDD